MPDKPIKPVYVIHGSDEFLRQACRQEAIAQVIDGGDPQVCVSTFSGDVDLATVLDELRTLPFLAPRRAVVVEDADEFISRYREIEVRNPPGARSKTTKRNPLEEYLQAPSKNSALILMVSLWNPKTRLAIIVAKIGQAYSCAPPEGGALHSAIRQAASKRGKRINPDAAELLAVWIGPDMAAIGSELDKLTAYVGERESITSADVSMVVTATAGPGPFELTNAITAGDTRAALASLSGMLTGRGQEFRVLAVLASHLRKAARAQQLAAAGGRPESALAPNIPPAAKTAFLNMLRRRPIGKFQSDFRKLIAADLGLKSGLDATAAMQELVVALCT